MESKSVGNETIITNQTVLEEVKITKRADALDALRGIAVLAMVLSGTIAPKILPAWMYHAQLPPPTHDFNPKLPGLTWVDLVFPFFLFAMGAAIPLALSRRIAKGWDTKQILLGILQRGFLLVVFAIFLEHLRPTVIDPNDDQNWEKWWYALKGFVIICFMFVRLPDFLPRWIRQGLTIAAWIIGLYFIRGITYPDGVGLSLKRSDIILMVLANMAIIGSILWYYTRSNLWLRVGFLGLLFSLKLSADVEGWVKGIWLAKFEINWHFILDSSWIFNSDFFKYLFIVIPGTIAGDLIYHWLEARQEEGGSQNYWKPQRFLIITIVMFSLNIVVLIGLQGRYVVPTILAVLGIGLVGFIFCQNPRSVTEKFIYNLYQWGFYWLILGLCFEPYQGGIKKDPATMSYLFITTGLAIAFLIGLTILMEVFPLKRFFLLFIDNGINPMLGYMLFANLIWPILILNDWEKTIIEMTSVNPIKGFLRGFVYTFILGCLVSLLTRLKFILRT